MYFVLGKRGYANTSPRQATNIVDSSLFSSDPDRTTDASSGIGAAVVRQLGGRYALMTAAYNEEENIGQTIESVLAQTRRPERWVIVSDGSQDGTDAIVEKYAAQYEFIRFLRLTRAPGRNFGAKVRALQKGYKLLESTCFEFIGNLDADITLEPTYFENLIERFDHSPQLGIAGGFIHEKMGAEFQSRRSNRTYSVAHAGQLVRRQCYEQFGGYAVLEFGGEDWHAQTSARMNGWEAEAFPDLRILHHRRTGEGDDLVRYKFRQGRMDYCFGSLVGFEVLKCLQRVPERPFAIGGMARLTGFLWSYLQREKRPVASEFIAFLRNEQRAKLRFSLNRVRTNVQSKDLR
jgi:Glycosyl transferase family 2